MPYKRRATAWDPSTMSDVEKNEKIARLSSVYTKNHLTYLGALEIRHGQHLGQRELHKNLVHDTPTSTLSSTSNIPSTSHIPAINFDRAPKSTLPTDRPLAGPHCKTKKEQNKRLPQKQERDRRRGSSKKADKYRDPVGTVHSVAHRRPSRALLVGTPALSPLPGPRKVHPSLVQREERNSGRAQSRTGEELEGAEGEVRYVPEVTDMVTRTAPLERDWLAGAVSRGEPGWRRISRQRVKVQAGFSEQLPEGMIRAGRIGGGRGSVLAALSKSKVC
ncbi:hypothetical protein KM043_006768 [Ampulex compressa]|nr:hypothetical protein KM043_006768 [Ampulex compressa]